MPVEHLAHCTWPVLNKQQVLSLVNFLAMVKYTQNLPVS